MRSGETLPAYNGDHRPGWLWAVNGLGHLESKVHLLSLNSRIHRVARCQRSERD